jgi:two-component system cell cycle sensor histidine kinase/response regulator CckA
VGERQQKQQAFFPDRRRRRRDMTSRERNVRALILFGVSLGYGLLIAVILHLGMSGDQFFAYVSIYLYGILGCYGIVLLKQSYTDANRSRHILMEVLEKSAEARIIADPRDATIYSNARFDKLVEGCGAPSLDAFVKLAGNAEKTRKTIADMKKKAETEGLAISEMQVETAGRRKAWLQITSQPIAGWNGYMQWRFDDITHRYLMEAVIREEREKLKEFTDNAPVGFFSVDENGKFQFANDTLLHLFGADADTLIGRARLHDFLVTPPGSRSAPYDCFSEGGHHQHGDIMMRGAGGRVFKASITHSITRKEGGRIITCSIVYDLTAEQRMQQALKESEDRFQRLFEEAPVGICLLSPRGTISSANQTLAVMLRLPPEALNGRDLVDFVSKDMHDRAQDWLKRLASGGRAEAPFDITLKGAVEISAQIYARKLKAGDNFVLHFIDLTEKKNLEKQFTQSQKMQAVGQLAGGIAHDFNNLLTAMIGFCDLLLLRHKPGDPSFADIMQIKQNGNRAANLVRQLLAFSRQQTLQPKVLDLTDVLAELSHLVRRLIGANIELRLSHGSDLGLIKADQGQVEQVVVNLVVNARDAMPAGGKLTIHTFNTVNKDPRKLTNEETLPPGEWVTIEVEDTGTGISPEILPRIFEPFFSTKEVGAGTGLGLATVHGIVHQTGGYIDVMSKPRVGTTFTIFLPRYAETAADRKSAAPEEKQAVTDLTGTSTILLVEDEDAVRTFSARALSNKGYQVVDAPSGAAALALLEQGKTAPEILITDVMMPEMDGTALARAVREKYPHIKIIFISGYAEDRFKEHLGDGVWFLPKPFTLKQLATKVKEVIEDGAEKN